jgi:hypothetical protein
VCVCVPRQAAVACSRCCACMHGRPGKYGGWDWMAGRLRAVAVPRLAAAGTRPPPPGTSTCGGAPVCSYSAGSSRHQAAARVSSPLLDCARLSAWPGLWYGNGRQESTRTLLLSLLCGCVTVLACFVENIFHQIRIRWVTSFVPGPVHEHPCMIQLQGPGMQQLGTGE